MCGDAIEREFAFLDMVRQLNERMKMYRQIMDDKTKDAILNDAAIDVAIDAARYRWLREHSFVDHGDDGCIWYGPGFNQTKPENLDEKVDEFMAISAELKAREA